MTRAATFLAAVLDADAPVPPGLIGPGQAPAGKRFDVYRNNVAVSLTEALETGFPVVRKLVGAPFFAAMAGVFLRSHPPRSPVLAGYGDALPAFLETFPPAARLPYLGDVARLELALRRAYHAADAAPLAPEALTALPAERLAQARFGFAPAVTLLVSRFPVYGIWRANTQADAPRPTAQAETVLVTRPGFDPKVSLLSPGAGVFVAALQEGAGLAAAGDAARAHESAFDLSAALGLLLAGGAITTLTEGPAP